VAILFSPLSSPPETPLPKTPVTKPAGEITVKPGRTIRVSARATVEPRYEWELDGPGQISTQGPEPATYYTAPEKGGVISILIVKAYNDQGASQPTSLIINTLPIVSATVPLDAFAIPLVWITDSGDPEATMSLKASPNECHTGSDCLRFTYRYRPEPKGKWGRIEWRPFCIGEIKATRCENVEGWDRVEEFCTAFFERKSSCSIDVLKAGNLSEVDRLTFSARGENGGERVRFTVGDTDVPPIPGRPLKVTLTDDWKPYAIDLDGLDLADAVGLFIWSVFDFENQQGAVFYLDDIQFEGERVQIAATQPPRLSQHAEQRLADLFTRLCWVAYSPTHFDPTTTPIRWPSEDDVREDLGVLRSAGFNGLVTYGSNYADPARPGQMLDIPGLAQEAGFEGMVVGVWDPTNEDELQAAEQAGRYPVVVGYSVGNEGLSVHYDQETLVSAMERLRQTTDKPVSTTEEAHDYYENSPLWTVSDWTFPNVHPYFAGHRDPQEAVEWTERIFESLDSVSDKPLIFKEVGLPSGGDRELSESRQVRYYQLLQETNVTFVVFEAFDAPWKHLGRPGPDGTYWPDPEPHWGIFTSDRTPKEAAVDICQAW